MLAGLPKSHETAAAPDVITNTETDKLSPRKTRT